MDIKHLAARVNRRALLQTSALAAALPIGVSAQNASPVASPAAEPNLDNLWPFYGQDLSGDKAVSDGNVTAANVAGLVEAWTVDVGGPVSATPVIGQGVAYVGSYDGTLQAIDIRSGSVLWTYATGAAVPEPNLQIPLGITGSAAVDAGRVFVGDAEAVLHAIDAQTGEAIWTMTVDDQTHASIWSSPVVADGVVFVGVASIAKEVGFRGSVIAVDAESGEVKWQTHMVPEGSDGAGVFAVPAIDQERGRLYVGTQNAYSDNPAPYGDPISVVALDVETGEIDWVFTAPPGGGETAPVDDVGFSASPNLFTATVDGQERDLVGEGQKSGDFWALDRDTGEEVWSATVSPAGFLGGVEGTSAVANGVVVVPATDWPEFEGPASGLVSAFDAGTGMMLWTVEQTAPAASPVAISNDVVFHAGFDGILHAYSLTDGTELWSADLGASVSGGVAVAEGMVIVGAATPEFAPFIKAGNQVHAFAIGGGATPIAAPEATPIG